MEVELKTHKFRIVAQARFEFGSDGSGQKSTTGYRVVKQLPPHWVKTVSWLNKGKIHIVAHEPMFEGADKLAFTVEAHRSTSDWRGTAEVDDPRTLLVVILQLAPPAYPLPVPADDPFGGLMAPLDCGFDLQVWTR